MSSVRTAAAAATLMLLIGALVPGAAGAQRKPYVEDPLRPSNAFYAVLSVLATEPSGSFGRTGDAGAGFGLNGVIPLSTDRWEGPFAGTGFGIRLEYSEMLYGSAAYTGDDPALAGDEIYAGVRTHAAGVQLTRPGRVRLRPYGAALLASTTMLLDADRAGKLERRDGVGAIARVGSYLAFTRRQASVVLDLGAAYRLNGVRDHWRPGEVIPIRGSANYFEFTFAVGVAAHD